MSDDDRALLPFASDDDATSSAGHLIRRQWHGGRWFFSIVDVVAVLTESETPRRYWTDMKRRIKDEGFREVYAQCVQLKMRA